MQISIGLVHVGWMQVFNKFHLLIISEIFTTHCIVTGQHLFEISKDRHTIKSG